MEIVDFLTTIYETCVLFSYDKRPAPFYTAVPVTDDNVLTRASLWTYFAIRRKS